MLYIQVYNTNTCIILIKTNVTSLRSTDMKQEDVPSKGNICTELII